MIEIFNSACKSSVMWTLIASCCLAGMGKKMPTVNKQSIQLIEKSSEKICFVVNSSLARLFPFFSTMMDQSSRRCHTKCNNNLLPDKNKFMTRRYFFSLARFDMESDCAKNEFSFFRKTNSSMTTWRTNGKIFSFEVSAESPRVCRRKTQRFASGVWVCCRWTYIWLTCEFFVIKYSTQ